MILSQRNDSETTLATPPPLASTILDFDHDDVFNVSVYFRCSCPSAASPLYTIKTSGPLTVVRRHNVPIAAIERSSIAPDCITLWPSTHSTPGMYVDASLSGTEGDVSSHHDIPNDEADMLYTLEECGIMTCPRRANGRRTELNEWLSSPEASTYPVRVQVADTVYEWGEDPAGELILYDVSLHPHMPLALFHPSKKGDGSLQSTHLTIHTRSNDLRDAALVSFVALEQRRRVVRGNGAR